jgi:hypothetical protein
MLIPKIDLINPSGNVVKQLKISDNNRPFIPVSDLKARVYKVSVETETRFTKVLWTVNHRQWTH